MTQQQPRPRFTVQDYMTTPEDKRYQLLDGEMILGPSPTIKHQRILGNLFRLLDAALAALGRGRVRLSPLDVVLSDYDVAH